MLTKVNKTQLAAFLGISAPTLAKIIDNGFLAETLYLTNHEIREEEILGRSHIYYLHEIEPKDFKNYCDLKMELVPGISSGMIRIVTELKNNAITANSIYADEWLELYNEMKIQA